MAKVKLTPIELLEKAIEAGKWADVSRAYTSLTGKVVKPGEPSKDKLPKVAIATKQEIAWNLIDIDEIPLAIQDEIRQPLVNAINEHCLFLLENDLLQKRATDLQILVNGETEFKPLTAKKSDLQVLDAEEPSVFTPKKTAKPVHREKFDIDRFQIQNNQPTSEDGKACIAKPYVRPSGVNLFDSDPIRHENMKDAEEDKKMQAKVHPSPRRDAAPPQEYTLKCSKCGNDCKVDLIDYQKTTNSTLDMDYCCVQCIKRAVRRD